MGWEAFTVTFVQDHKANRRLSASIRLCSSASPHAIPLWRFRSWAMRAANGLPKFSLMRRVRSPGMKAACQTRIAALCHRRSTPHPDRTGGNPWCNALTSWT